MKGFEEYVREILEDIRRRGFEVLREYLERFDNYLGLFRVLEGEFEEVEEFVLEEDKRVIEEMMECFWEYYVR